MTSSARPGNPRHAGARRPLAFVHHAVAGQIHVLGVLDDRYTEMLGVLEGPAHQLGVRDRAAVVGDGDGAGGDHRAHRRELPALEPLADGADRKDPGQRRALGGAHDDAGDPSAVVGGKGVGHAGDRA
jgi:hypothetical protein